MISLYFGSNFNSFLRGTCRLVFARHASCRLSGGILSQIDHNNNLATYIAQTNPAIVAAQGAHTNNITTYSSYTIIH